MIKLYLEMLVIYKIFVTTSLPRVTTQLTRYSKIKSVSIMNEYNV